MSRAMSRLRTSATTARLLLFDAEFLQRRAAERDSRFEGFAELVVGLVLHELDCMDPIVGPHESQRAGKFCMHDFDDLHVDVSGPSTHTQIISALPAPAARSTSRRVPSP